MRFKRPFYDHDVEYEAGHEYINTMHIVHNVGNLSHLTIRVYLKNGRCIIVSFMCSYNGHTNTTSLCMLAHCNDYNKMLTKEDSKMTDNEILEYINIHIGKIVNHISHIKEV